MIKFNSSEPPNITVSPVHVERPDSKSGLLFRYASCHGRLLSLRLTVRKALPNHTMDIICKTLAKESHKPMDMTKGGCKIITALSNLRPSSFPIND